AAGTPAHQVAREHLADHATGYIDVLSSGRYQVVLGGPSGVRLPSPVTFGTEAAATGYLARVNDILKNTGAPGPRAIFNGPAQSTTRGGYQTARRPDWSVNLPCGFSCGANGSGGDHFWVIASYQQIVNATVIATFATACVAYLVPEIQWWAAPACAAVVYILKTLAENEPRVTNHGVWAAIYFTHPWSPQSGHY
ncbi:MAG: hypothetical protein ACRDOU_30995, partial [Streptosporangiaceae bacterium]